MIFAALAGLLTPASWITIWLSPWTATFGEDTPILLTRLVMICCAVAIPCGVIGCFLVSGIARRTTSRPPCRSRPSVGFLYAGEPGTAINAAPTSSATIAPMITRYLRRSLTKDPSSPRNRLAAVLLIRCLGDRAFVLLRLDGPGVLRGLGSLVLLGLARHARDRAPGDLHFELRRDLDRHAVVVDLRDRSVDPAGGEHLVTDAQVTDHLSLLVLTPLL